VGVFSEIQNSKTGTARARFRELDAKGSSGVDLGLYRSLFRVKRQENHRINGLDLLLGVLLVHGGEEEGKGCQVSQSVSRIGREGWGARGLLGLGRRLGRGEGGGERCMLVGLPE